MLGLIQDLIHTSYIIEPGDTTLGDTTYSLLLDGDNSALDTGHSFQSTFRGSFSISAWIKPDDGTPASVQNIFGVIPDNDNSILFLLNQDGKMQFQMESAPDNINIITTSPHFSNGQESWRHVVATLEKSTGTDPSVMSMYIDGVHISGANITTVGQLSKANHEAFTNSTPVYVGATFINPFVSVSKFIGKIDEFAIWSTILDADAVTEIYSQRHNTIFSLKIDNGDYNNSSDLVSYYRMNEGSGSTVADSTGANNGTLLPTATFDLDSPDDEL